MKLIQRAGASAVTTLPGGLLLWVIAAPAAAEEVTVLCNFEVDWCEALKTAYEKTTGQKAVFIRRTDGESLAQIRAEKGNPRADVVHAAESASAKALAAEGLLEAYKSPMVAELHDWAQRIAEENKYFQTPIYTGVLGFGYNTELLAKNKMPEPKCWVLPSPIPTANAERIGELAIRLRIPSITANKELMERGLLMSYGADIRDVQRRIPSYVDRILKGAKPADMAVERPTKFELAITMKTARAIGLAIPQSLLLRADDVIR